MSFFVVPPPETVSKPKDNVVGNNKNIVLYNTVCTLLDDDARLYLSEISIVELKDLIMPQSTVAVRMTTIKILMDKFPYLRNSLQPGQKSKEIST